MLSPGQTFFLTESGSSLESSLKCRTPGHLQSLQDEQQPRAPGDRTTGRSLRSQVGIASINQMSCIGRNQELETELAFEVRASGQS